MPEALLDFLSSGLFSPSLLLGLWLLLSIELTILTVTLYLHRSQAHRAVDFHPALAHFFRFWNWLSTGMVVREWVAVPASTTPAARRRKTRTAPRSTACRACSGTG